MAATQTEPTPAPQPLTADENKLLADLLARSSADKTPATRIGQPYEALIALSVPRRGDKDRQTDLVMPGEVVYLTEDEARAFNRRGGRDGRQAEVVRPLSGADGSRERLPQVGANGSLLLPRHVSGRLFRPLTPPPGSDAPRPDPDGSSRIQYLQDGAAPESAGAQGPQPGEMDEHLRDTVQADAVDLPPGGRGRTRARGGAAG